MLHYDYLMRQINGLCAMLAKLLFKKDTFSYNLPQEDDFTEPDILYLELVRMIKAGEINEAEDLLYAQTDPSNKRYLELAIDFYSKLNELDDEFLEAHEYTREEIEEGLKGFAAMYHFPVTS